MHFLILLHSQTYQHKDQILVDLIFLLPLRSSAHQQRIQERQQGVDHTSAFPSAFTPCAVVTFKFPKPTVVTSSGSGPILALAVNLVGLALSFSGTKGSGLLTFGRGFFRTLVGRLALAAVI